MPQATERNASAAPQSSPLHDLQSEPDHRALKIDKVGIRGLKLPIKIQGQADKQSQTVATFDVYVNLPQDVKGTHMSRFVEVLHEYEGTYSINTLEQILQTIVARLNAQTAYLTIRFPFFLEKSSPISGRSSLMDYQVTLRAQLDAGALQLQQEVMVPVKTLCPCSKSISKYGAHNQRGHVTVKFRSDEPIWTEQIIRLVEASGSAELYAILKRPDEKYVTEQAYENPVFVEDLVRNVVTKLRSDKRITWYEVEAENHESIHNHNAYALIKCSET